MTSPNIPVYAGNTSQASAQPKTPAMTPGQKRLQRHLLSGLYNEPALCDDTPSHARDFCWIDLVGQR